MVGVVVECIYLWERDNWHGLRGSHGLFWECFVGCCDTISMVSRGLAFLDPGDSYFI